jgi:hypothetical protein
LAPEFTYKKRPGGKLGCGVVDLPRTHKTVVYEKKIKSPHSPGPSMYNPMDLPEDRMPVLFRNQRPDCSGRHITVKSLPFHLKRRDIQGRNACSL